MLKSDIVFVAVEIEIDTSYDTHNWHVQFKKLWKTLMEECYFYQSGTTKSNTPPWFFSRFSNCTNITKSRKASHIITLHFCLRFFSFERVDFWHLVNETSFSSKVHHQKKIQNFGIAGRLKTFDNFFCKYQG